MSRKITVFFLLWAFYCQSSFSQSPFVFRGELDFPIVISTFSMVGITQHLSNKHDFKTVDYINGLKREQVNGFDRSATFQNMKAATLL